jgi:DNA-directed RNA polymerase subunit RPC12/RpoP
MRADIAKKYHDLTTNPQPIIYSTIPPEERSDFLPPRAGTAAGVVQDADEFTLADDVISVPSDRGQSARPAETDFTLSPTGRSAALDGPDKPQTVTGQQEPVASSGSSGSPPAGTETAQPTAASSPSETSRPAGDARPEKPAPDDLLAIALREQRDDRRRKNERQAERQKRQVLVPCSCGAWLRVHEDFAGRVVRCRQCRNPIQIPEIRRKVTEKKEDKPAAQINVTWINDVWFHVLAPGSVTLKPGSVAAQHISADIALTPDAVHIVSFSGAEKKKKSLLSFGSGAKSGDLAAVRRQIREQVAATGGFQGLSDCQVRSIPADQVSVLKLVQPILKVHESMFAGVPIFGEGRVAVFLPVETEQGQQAYCSFPLSAWRHFGSGLKELFGISLPTAENGVPESEKLETLSCFVNQSKVEAIKSLVYYQQDPSFELELSGYRCKACGAAFSEEGRKKNKLGGANGKAIAKAKCPKCGGKIGEDPLYRIRKAPERPTEAG